MAPRGPTTTSARPPERASDPEPSGPPHVAKIPRRGIARRRAAITAGLAVAGVLSALVPRPAAGGEPPIVRTPEFRRRVDEGIAKGVAWLRSRQQDDGGFSRTDALEHSARTYHTLRVCRVERDDPAMVRAWAFLEAKYAEEKEFNRSVRSHLGTEEAGLLCLAVASHGTVQPAPDGSGEVSYVVDPKDRAWLAELVKFLESAQRANGTWPQFVDLADEPGEVDVSFTYFALLGLKAASRAGVKVQTATWSKALQYVRGQQDTKGETLPPAATPAGSGSKPLKARGWDLSNRRGSADFFPSDWDTANALACLAICRSEILAAQKGKPLGDAATEAAFRDGLAYLGHETFILESLRRRSDAVTDSYFEDAYTIERAGDLLGVERMGTLDWYGVGAEALLALQDAAGGWYLKGSADEDLRRSCSLRATSSALLFLARGTPRVRWTTTAEPDDADIRFAAASSLGERDFEDFVDLVLSRWRRSSDAAAKERILAKATAVGPRIVPSLVRRLSSDAGEVREAAIALLVRATGLDHGFDPAGAAEARAAGVGRWNEWWTEHGATLRYDPGRDRLVP